MSNDSIGGVEKVGETDIKHTKKDSINEIINIYGMTHIHARFENTINTVVNTLTDTNFVAEMKISKDNPTVVNFFYSKYFNIIVSVIVFGLFILGVYLVNKKVGKEVPEKIENHTQSQRRANVTEEDIFNMFETIKKQQRPQQPKQPPKNDDDDDIFG